MSEHSAPFAIWIKVRPAGFEPALQPWQGCVIDQTGPRPHQKKIAFPINKRLHLTDDRGHHSPTDHRTDREDSERYRQTFGDGGAFCQIVVSNLYFRRIADEDDR